MKKMATNLRAGIGIGIGSGIGMSTDSAEDSPIESIFYCEFHPTAGPRIVYQVPSDVVTKEAFDSLSDYLIPKNELERRLLTVNALGLKIIGYPVGLSNARYARNRLIFNLCFVCRPFMRTFQYEPIVKKLTNYLINLELECEFLSREQTKQRLPEIMAQIQEQLNVHKVCKIDVTPSITINLKIVKVYPDPEPVQDEQVPVFLTTSGGVPMPSQWDLTTQQIIPYIDGYRHVARIAAEADVEMSLVKACIQNMIYYGIVKMIPIFQYSNFYVPTHKLIELNDNLQLQTECMFYVAKRLPPRIVNLSHTSSLLINPASSTANLGLQLPTFRSIFKFYCSMNYGVTIRDLCLMYNPNSLNIDEKKLVRFGLMKGMIRRVHRYPVLLSQSNTSHDQLTSVTSSNDDQVSRFTSSGNFGQQQFSSPNSIGHSGFGVGAKSTTSSRHHRHTPISIYDRDVDGHSQQSILQQQMQNSTRIPFELFDGNHNYDQICCKAQKLNLTVRKLSDEIDKHDDILLIYK